ncbi:CHAT domain-containing protein [Crepidotus variabilis]|uniref:CHAT domain-containing protein n=1 Tax=Crepidotus variabilis TaxID=179855 RepID=A0A9P6JKZ0_9AGAR|nr:CHAT domain-containing protein [Crepidotus variabilis]
MLLQFQETGSIADISSAIYCFKVATLLIPGNHQNMPAYLSNLGNALSRRFERTGDLADISAAIEYHQKAIELSPKDNVNMPLWLCNLGTSFSIRFKRTGDLADISAAIRHHQKAVEITPERHAGMPKTLCQLASSFLSRFKRTGDLPNVTTAIEHYKKAVQLTPNGHADTPKMLANLGSSLLIRFEQTGGLADISATIEYHQKAIELTPDGHASKYIDCNNLGNSFLKRFLQTGDLDDISASIEYHLKSTSSIPEDHVDLPMMSTNLGNSFLKRFEQTGDLVDLSAAIDYTQKAVNLAPEGHADMPSWLGNLGNSLLTRFKLTEDLVDISTAIDIQQKALMLIPEGHVNMPSLLNSYGSLLSARFKCTGDLADISAAIENQQRAIELTPEHHADMALWQHNLGDSLMSCFNQTKKEGDCQAAALNYRLAATQNTGRPTARLHAARRWARCLLVLNNEEALHAYSIAIELLPLVASLHQTIHNRHKQLFDISDLTSEAVAMALLLQRNDLALEWFEQGRCLIWTQLNQLRTPVDLLRHHDAGLAERFLAVSKALETSGSRSETPWQADSTITQHIAVESQVRLHLKLAEEFEQLLANVRSHPGFSDFLRPPKTASILSRLPAGGPIVIINLQKATCNALALIHGADDPLRICLNNFSYQKAELLRKQLGYHLTCEKVRLSDSAERAGRPAVHPDRAGLHHILRELWNGVVWPILEALGYSSPPVHRNRIWWCPTGPLAFLPIHAAGIYNPDGQVLGSCLSDFAVSSYIPTVTTLLEKVNNTANLTHRKTRLLLLSQPNALPYAPIPGTVIETRVVRGRMQEADIEVILLEDGEGTKNRVTEEMGSHGWVHIASHASQHPTEPLKSGFYLHDGQLELLEIIRQQIPRAEFAYLSACQTSVGNDKLTDEVIHLAAGMLAAGYQGVVATMWSINDQYAPKIAENFYGCLLQEMKDRGVHRLDSSQAAYALDDATRTIRANLGDSEHALLTWVPYIHHGL